MGILKGSQTYIESSSFLHQDSSSINGIPSPHLKNVSCRGIFEKLAFPLSRGELKLRSRDPRDNPSVRYNYYSHPLDLQRCVQGVRMIAKLLTTRSLRRFAYPASNGSSIDAPLEFQFTTQALPKNTSDDAAMAQFCKDTLSTIWHFHGGCHVGSVINQRYQVNGIDSLRIVDGSTFTDCPGTNPQATTMMLGR